MKKDLPVLLFLGLITSFVYFKSFNVFFAQDDFILINHFSQNGFLADLGNVIGAPKVTHWRPVHNIYFLTAGRLFGGNFAGYHAFNLLIHIGSGFFIYKISELLFKKKGLAIFSALIYLVHPAHFVSMFWISGGATVIGFFFLSWSFWKMLLGKYFQSIFLYILALLSSEAMLGGLAIIWVWSMIKRRSGENRFFLFRITLLSIIFLFIKFYYFTPSAALEIYKVEFSARIFESAKYYLLRVLGFAEVSGDFVLSAALLSWWLILIALQLRANVLRKNLRTLFLIAAIFFCGLFPFVLIPEHMSPHYMNISIWGSAIFAALSLSKFERYWIAFAAIFVIISFLSVQLTFQNNWMIKRSSLARAYITKIQQVMPRYGSTIVFDDNPLSTSKEAYISLGTGRAQDVLFKGKSYVFCFTFITTCGKNESGLLFKDD